MIDFNRFMSRVADPDDPFGNVDIDESSPYHRDRARQPQGTWGDTDYPTVRGNDPATSDQQNQRPGRNLPVWGGGRVDETEDRRFAPWRRPSPHFDPANPQGVEPGSTWHDEQRQPWEGTTRIGATESELYPTPGLRDEATLAPNNIVPDLRYPVYVQQPQPQPWEPGGDIFAPSEPPRYDREGVENQRGPLTVPLPIAPGQSHTPGIEDPNSPRSIYRVPLGGGQPDQRVVQRFQRVSERWRRQFGRDPSPQEAQELMGMLGGSP